jgi:hypothetical protein
MMTTVTARRFNHDVSAVKRLASTAPVVITDRGHATHVLLSYAEYNRITSKEPTLGEAFVVEDDAQFPAFDRTDDGPRDVQW